MNTQFDLGTMLSAPATLQNAVKQIPAKCSTLTTITDLNYTRVNGLKIWWRA